MMLPSARRLYLLVLLRRPGQVLQLAQVGLLRQVPRHDQGGLHSIQPN
jgi:hypothetical protein